MKKIYYFFAACMLLLASCKNGVDTPNMRRYTVTFFAIPGTDGTLTAKTKDGVTITSGDRVAAGTVIDFTASPRDGYKIGTWEGATEKDGSYKRTATLKVTKDATVTVSFTAAEKQKISFSAEPPEGGSVTAKNKDSGADITSGTDVYEGTVIELTASPQDGYRIGTWEGEGLQESSDKTTATLMVTQDAEVKVVFIKTYKIDFSAEPQDGGTLTAKNMSSGAPITSGEQVDEGTVIEFTASPHDGYKIDKWDGDGLKESSYKRIATLTVKKDATVTVSFTAAQKKKITLFVEPPGGGTLTAKNKYSGANITSGTDVYEGTVIVFTAKPSDISKYFLEKWVGVSQSPSESTTEAMVTTDMNVKVTFKELTIYEPQWIAAGQVETKDGSPHNLVLVVNERMYITVFDLTTGKKYFVSLTYDDEGAPDKFQLWEGSGKDRKTVGYIKFTTKSKEIPSNWDIIFTNDGEQDITFNAHSSPDLTFKSGTAATVRVTLNEIIE